MRGHIYQAGTAKKADQLSLDILNLNASQTFRAPHKTRQLSVEGKESYSGSVCSSISPLSKEEEDESGNDYEWNASNASKHRVESPQHRKMDTVVCSSLDAVQSRDRQLGAASLMCAVGRQVGCHADSCATLLTNTFADERRQPSAAANGVDS
ncbi:unnamed protein product [Toxocara canis]|uniref:Uncharacterized protein n=1 Tax=Toxocara canis TaxID=6265 RepID=A0A183TZE8_TOXCA|nr:unnamed protein product [Toxocara canis]